MMKTKKTIQPVLPRRIVLARLDPSEAIYKGRRQDTTTATTSGTTCGIAGAG